MQFDWDVAAAEGCTFLGADKPPGWKNADVPCCRCAATHVDHFEPREPHLLDDGFESFGVAEDFLVELGSLGPQTAFAIEIKRGNHRPVGADVQLQVLFKALLVPSGVFRARGVAENRACLAVLLPRIQRRRMCDLLGQGIGEARVERSRIRIGTG